MPRLAWRPASQTMLYLAATSQLVVAVSVVPSSAPVRRLLHVSPPQPNLPSTSSSYTILTAGAIYKKCSTPTLIEVDIKWVNDLLSKQENFRHPDRGYNFYWRQGSSLMLILVLALIFSLKTFQLRLKKKLAPLLKRSQAISRNELISEI